MRRRHRPPPQRYRVVPVRGLLAFASSWYLVRGPRQHRVRNRHEFPGVIQFFRYLAKVTLHLAKNADIFNYSQFVAVIPRRHLSTEKHLLFEGRIDVTRSFQTYRAEGYVTVSVWLPISGIAAGQGLPVLCSITNCSRLHFGSILFMLTRTDIYRWACLICRPQFILQTGG